MEKDSHLQKIGQIQAIPTFYKDYLFRSRLEARWAVFFDALDLKWDYEPEGYLISSGPYLPDFFIHDIGIRTTKTRPGIWVEIKPIYDQIAAEKLGEVCAITRNGGLLLADSSVHNDWNGEKYQVADNDGACYPDIGMVFMQCLHCGEVKIEFSEGNYLFCDDCNHPAGRDTPKILEAVAAARLCRFGSGRKRNGI